MGLMISLTPTHPTNASNCSRILNICNLLKKNCYNVSFLFIDRENEDLHQSIKIFNNKFFYIKEITSDLKKCNDFCIL